MKLTDHIAIVTGASRGVGKGIALGLGEAGATVYVTGRTTGSGELTIDTTAKMVDDAGGHGIAVRVDHGVDADIAALFEQAREERVSNKLHIYRTRMQHFIENACKTLSDFRYDWCCVPSTGSLDTRQAVGRWQTVPE